jgi:hypothetical protein
MSNRMRAADRIRAMTDDEFRAFDERVGEGISRDDYIVLLENPASSLNCEKVFHALGLRTTEERSARATESTARAAWFAVVVSLISLVVSIVALLRSSGR